MEALATFLIRPWEERGKPVDEQWLAKQLRPYGIQPGMMWIDGQRYARGSPHIAVGDTNMFYCIRSDAGNAKNILFIPERGWVTRP